MKETLQYLASLISGAGSLLAVSNTPPPVNLEKILKRLNKSMERAARNRQKSLLILKNTYYKGPGVHWRDQDFWFKFRDLYQSEHNNIHSILKSKGFVVNYFQYSITISWQNTH